MPKPSFRYSKRLGQHFLNNLNVAKRIVNLADIGQKTVLEIGAGKGMLTKVLAPMANKIYAVEIDKNLVDRLKSLNLSNMTVINADFLKLDLSDFEQPIIVGNIPYSITTPILQKLIEQRNYFKKAVLTIQKEYGERLLAPVGGRQYGAITIYLSYYFSLKKGFTISAQNFSPKPKVNSMVVALTIKDPPFILKNEKLFFGFVRGVFCYRRKSLRNAIFNYLHKKPEGIDQALLNKRPENLSLHDFYHLFEKLGLA